MCCVLPLLFAVEVHLLILQSSRSLNYSAYIRGCAALCRSKNLACTRAVCRPSFPSLRASKALMLKGRCLVTKQPTNQLAKMLSQARRLGSRVTSMVFVEEGKVGKKRSLSREKLRSTFTNEKGLLSLPFHSLNVKRVQYNPLNGETKYIY